MSAVTHWAAHVKASLEKETLGSSKFRLPAFYMVLISWTLCQEISQFLNAGLQSSSQTPMGA